jgi:hypothetical protein
MKLDLTLPEINVIMQALGQMPYVSVVDLVVKIREQTHTQLALPQGASDV